MSQNKRVLAVPAGSDHGSVRFPVSGRSSASAWNAGKTGEPPKYLKDRSAAHKAARREGRERGRPQTVAQHFNQFQCHLKRGLLDGGK
ncbi:hypothetical protein CDAR_274551 [Caerostris darwini]|uniref:Uncharacterized protein n=1 Tax=Caerostris darwini TaxID=1538125 RepID=A0AAV4RHQ9_9ARAC|nr:hypothetical protein CDAR_274551 [Caerostris darwini]